MRKPKFKKWWYGHVSGLIRDYSKFENEDTEMTNEIREAMRKTVIETANTFPDWPDRYKAISCICFRGLSMDDTAKELFYSKRTITRWWNRFVYDVGKNLGF